MKFGILVIIALVLFSCQKDDVIVKQSPLEMETISGTVSFKNETGPHAPILVILTKLSILNELDTLMPLKDTIATTYTDENGNYVFDQVLPGEDTFGILITLPTNYRHIKSMDETPDGDFLESYNSVFNNYYFIGTKLLTDEVEDNNNFYIGSRSGTSKVSGYVFSVTENIKKPMANITVWITDRNDLGGPGGIVIGQATTNAEGYYEITADFDFRGLLHTHMGNFPVPINLITSRKSIDESPDTDPAPLDNISIPVDIVDFEVDDQNNFYFYIAQTPSISGKILLDTDNNGTGDVGVAGQRIELYKRSNNIPTTPLIKAVNSNTNGTFSFDYLSPGEYILYFIGTGNYNIVKGYDQDQEAGEPNNSNPQFINVNLTNDMSQDSLNYFILKAKDCNHNLHLTEYWALCDTNIVCSLNQLPIICVDENNKPVTQLTGNKFKWKNLVTGETSNSDVIMCAPYESLKLTIDLTDGCSYDLFYSRDCAKDLHGGSLHMTLIEGGFQPNFAYQQGEIIWKFDVFKSTLNVTHNITSPVATHLVPPGVYTYTLSKNGVGKYQMDIVSNTTGVEYSLGQIGYENGKIIFDSGLSVDGIKLTFTKH